MKPPNRRRANVTAAILAVLGIILGLFAAGNLSSAEVAERLRF